MEQLSLTAGRESERVVQILTDLMKNNKEFQIMITVPAAGKESGMTPIYESLEKEEKGHDLEKG